jgi:hypothetical protein
LVLINFKENYCLEMGMHSVRSGTDPTPRVISRTHLHNFHSTAGIKTSSKAGVRTHRGRPGFTRAVGVTLASHGDAATNGRNTLTSG